MNNPYPLQAEPFRFHQRDEINGLRLRLSEDLSEIPAPEPFIVFVWDTVGVRFKFFDFKTRDRAEDWYCTLRSAALLGLVDEIWSSNPTR